MVVDRRSAARVPRQWAAMAVVVGLSLAGCEQKPCAKACAWSGQCTPGAQPDSCVAANDADCHASKACRYYGKCTAVANACARTSAKDCQRSNKCLWAGECGFVAGKCSAVDVADCRRSKYCKEKGMCRLKAKYGGLAVCTK